MTQAQLLLLARTVAVVTFALSALSKARDLDGFHATIRDFKLAGDRQARLLAPVITVVELAVVVLCAIGSGALGLWLASGLLVAYTAVLTNARAHGATVGCNCFGKKQQPISWYDVGRNLLLLAATVAGLVAALGSPSDLHGWGSALAVPLGAGVVLLAVNLGLVVEALRHPLPVQETA